MNKRVQGKVLWYDEAQGYGFLSQIDGESVHVHRSALAAGIGNVLSPGQNVEYSITLSPKGIQAADVTGLN